MKTVSTNLRAHRLLVCHKHPSSGRLRFIHFATGNICGPEALPKLAVLHAVQDRSLLIHPTLVLQPLADYLSIDARQLHFIGDFRLFLEVPHQFAPEGILPILLIAIAGHELPPLPDAHHWLEMPDSFTLPYLEREILLAAYRHLME